MLAKILLSILIFNSEICFPSKVPESQIKNYMNGLTSLESNFKQQQEQEGVYEGKIFIKLCKNPKVLIEYNSGICQNVLVENKTVIVYEKHENKFHKASISGTPIYEILTGSFDFSSHKVSIDQETQREIIFSLDRKSDGSAPIILIFSKYGNGNLKNLKGWSINDGKNITTFVMDENTMRVNDPKSVPDSIFKIGNNNPEQS